MNPEPRIIIRGPSRTPEKLLLFAVAAGGIMTLLIWSRMGMEQTPNLPAAAANPIVQPANKREPVNVPRDEEINTDVLRGEGITVAGWLKKAVAAAPGRVRFSPQSQLENFAASLPSLWICEYDGDASLPLGEALDLLRYAGLSIAQIYGSNVYEVRWADTQTLIAADLSASTDPDNLTWGALRSWQHVTLKTDSQWRSLLSDAKTPATLARLRALAWAVQGEVCRIDIGADGHVAALRSSVPAPDELDAALNVLESSVRKIERPIDVGIRGVEPGMEETGLAFDAVVGLAALANTETPSKLSSRTERAIAVLSGGLNATDLEMRRMSAWALGRTPAVPALEALVNAVENANSPGPLVSAALVALTHSEKYSRWLDAAALGEENWSRRQAACQRLRNWLALPHPATADMEYTEAFLAAAESFQVDLSLPHIKSFQSRLKNNQPTLSDVSVNVAGPNWLHIPFEAEGALNMLRTDERRNIIAALWRWNRMGADSPTALAWDNTEAALTDSIKAILKAAPSATQRRLALEALFRSSDARLGGAPRALCDETGLALNAFLRDPSPAMQRSASVIVGKLAGIVQLQTLVQAELAARPPAGTEQLLTALVQRFWMNNSNTEDVTVLLTSFIDPLLAAADTHVAERAAWARMQDPSLEVTEKLRAAKGMRQPSLRAAALKSINVSRAPTEVHSKWVDVFLYDNAAIVREAVFDAHLPQWVKRGPERTKLYARGLQDQEASVRLAVLNSRLTIALDSREALNERVKLLAEGDASQEVRAAAAAWLLPGMPARPKE